MAWCNYCRCYTVNGQCPNCGRIYQDPNKNYDFYGNEIKQKKSESSKKKSESSSSSYHGRTYSDYAYDDDEGSFAGGFWLAIPISFIAIIIASAINKPRMRKGAILGTIIGAVFALHIAGIIIVSYFNMLETNGFNPNDIISWFQQ